MQAELLQVLKVGLRKELESELDYFNFEMTTATKEWVDSVVDYYAECFENEESFDDAMDVIEDSEQEEDYEFSWPSVSEAAVIIEKALRDDSAHFEYITEQLGYSMTPDDCFKAEWFWEGSIRPEIILWLHEFCKEKNFV